MRFHCYRLVFHHLTYTTCGKTVSLLEICCVSCQACQWDAEILQTTELPIGLLCQCIHSPSTSLSAVLLVYAHYHACETLTVYQDNRVSSASPLGPAHLQLLQLFAKRSAETYIDDKHLYLQGRMACTLTFTPNCLFKNANIFRC